MAVRVEDSAQVLSPAQKTDLEAISTPHKVVALLENPASKDALQQHVKACVSTPNTLCIGVSPKLRYTWTEIGLDTGIRAADYQQVGRAGNVDFKAAVGGDADGWPNGIKSIISRAQVLAHRELAAPTGVVIQQPQTVVEHPVSAAPFLVGFGVLASLIGVAAFFVLRAQRRTREALENSQRETAELASRNVRDQDWAEAVTARVGARRAVEKPRAYSPGSNPGVFREGHGFLPLAQPPAVVVDRSGNDMASGILIGQALSQPTYRHESYRPLPRDVIPAPRSRRDETPAPSYSSSSSSSSTSSYSSGGGSDYSSSSGGGGGGDFSSSSGGGGGGDF
jgi:uncharacterized membrane protein YgcG